MLFIPCVFLVLNRVRGESVGNMAALRKFIISILSDNDKQRSS